MDARCRAGNVGGLLAAGHRLCALQPAGSRFPDRGNAAAGDLDADDFRRSNPRFQGENFARNLALVEKVAELAKRKGVAPSQLALAWVLAQGEHSADPGTKRRRYLEENIAAAELTLSEAELAAIEAVFPFQAAAGPRYGAESMAYING